MGVQTPGGVWLEDHQAVQYAQALMDRVAVSRGTPKPNAQMEQYIEPELAKSTEALAKSIPREKAERSYWHISPALTKMGYYEGVKDHEKATKITLEVLGELAGTTFVRIVHDTIIAQAEQYAREAQFHGDTGWEIGMRAMRTTPTRDQQTDINDIADLVRDGGSWSYRERDDQPGVWDSTQTRLAPGFVHSLKILLDQSLTWDWAFLHREPGATTPAAYYAPLDAMRVHFAVPKGEPETYRTRIRKDSKEVKYVLLNEQREPELEMTWAEGAHWVRRPRAQRWVQGYGRSELEMLVDIVSACITGVLFNSEVFTSNHVPAGMAIFSGDFFDPVGAQWMEQVQADMKRNVGGPGKFHVLPMLFGEEGAKAEYVRFRGEGPLDMHWEKWMQFLVLIICTSYQMAPEEINFVSQRATGSALQESDPASRLQHSEDKGRIPRMRSLEDFLDRALVQGYKRGPGGKPGPYRLQWTGLRRQAERQALELAQMRMESGLSRPVDERAERNEPPIKDPLDRDTYQRLELRATELRPDLEHEDPEKYRRWVDDAYVEHDGEWALWPEAPVSPYQNQLWAQEHAEDLGGGDEDMMEMMGMGGTGEEESQPGEDNLAWDEMRDGQYQDKEAGGAEEKKAGMLDRAKAAAGRAFGGGKKPEQS